MYDYIYIWRERERKGESSQNIHILRPYCKSLVNNLYQSMGPLYNPPTNQPNSMTQVMVDLLAG